MHVSIIISIKVITSKINYTKCREGDVNEINWLKQKIWSKILSKSFEVYFTLAYKNSTKLMFNKAKLGEDVKLDYFYQFQKPLKSFMFCKKCKYSNVGWYKLLSFIYMSWWEIPV